MPDDLPPAALDALLVEAETGADRHVPPAILPVGSIHHCCTCNKPWPCLTSRLAAAVRGLRATEVQQGYDGDDLPCAAHGATVCEPCAYQRGLRAAVPADATVERVCICGKTADRHHGGVGVCETGQPGHFYHPVRERVTFVRPLTGGQDG